MLLWVIFNLPFASQWKRDEFDGPSLNLKQKESLVAISTPCDNMLPPILMVGPFGTGKTMTMARTVLHLLTERSNRILICTHSNRSVSLGVFDAQVETAY